VIGVLAVGAMVWATTQGITDEKDPGYRFNSFGSRIEAYDAAIDLWQSEPLFGVGVRFWTDPKTNDPQEPHNLAISALAESGIVGLAALVLLHAWLLVLLWPRRDPLGLLAAYVVIAHVVDSIAGIFWVAGTGTLGWLLVGLAAGVERHRDATSHLEQHPSIAER
jgi:O-antigen ligase